MGQNDPKDSMKTEDYFDLGLLTFLIITEFILWGLTRFSLLVLTYGFFCAVRGGQLSRMREEGVWRRLKSKQGGCEYGHKGDPK